MESSNSEPQSTQDRVVLCFIDTWLTKLWYVVVVYFLQTYTYSKIYLNTGLKTKQKCLLFEQYSEQY